MSFELVDERLVWIKVRFAGFVSIGDEIGRPVEHSIDMQVALVDRDVFNEHFHAPDPEVDFEAWKRWKEVPEIDRMMLVARDWRGVKLNKQPVPFSPENLSRMMQVPNFVRGFNQCYGEAYVGLKETRTGN